MGITRDLVIPGASTCNTAFVRASSKGFLKETSTSKLSPTFTLSGTFRETVQ
jgi:hypothetical protein